VNRQRVDAAAQLGGENRVNHSVTLDAGLAPEGLGDDMDPKVGLPTLPMSGVTLMVVRLVDHPEMLRMESLGQLSCDEIVHTHTACLAAAMRAGQRCCGEMLKSSFERSVKSCGAGHLVRIMGL
jgi:hypothetical protein